MMSNQDNENYIKLHQDAIDRCKEDGCTVEEIAFHKLNLEHHIKLDEVEDEQNRTKND